jgi:hypothetical protein
MWAAADRRWSVSVKLDVDRGLQICGQIEMLEEELDQIETRLVTAGLDGDQVELTDPEREGRQYLARGTESIVPVVFTADLLIKSFAYGSIPHGKIEAALGAHPIGNFFRRISGFATQFESGKKFRAQAAELLGQTAPQFISACLSRDKEGTPRSQIKVEWGRAQNLTADHADNTDRNSSSGPSEKSAVKKSGVAS